MNRKVEIILSKCNKKCPFFYSGEGLGHCDDWCDCTLASRRIHETSNGYSGKFPKFCPLPKTRKMI